MHDDGYHHIDRGAPVVLCAPGLVAGMVPGEPLGLFGPTIGFGLVIASCAHPACGNLAQALEIVSTLTEAGRLIAVIRENANRAGLHYALQAAEDQGAAWARGAPR